MMFDPAVLNLTEECVVFAEQKVTQKLLHSYAWASGDNNPIHYNDTVARGMGLPGVIAHGMLTLAYMNQSIEKIVQRLSTEFSQPARFSGVDTRFVGMLQVGDSVTIAAKTFRVTEKGFQLHLWAYKNLQRDQLVCTATAVVEYINGQVAAAERTTPVTADF